MLFLAVGVASLILLIPAIVNGFPFVYSDSGIYLSAAVQFHLPRDRPVYYSIFAAMLHWKLSPWPIVIAQSLLVIVLIRLVAKSVFSIDSPLVVIVVSLILVSVSSLPWFVGEITPDIFTAVLILCILLVALGWHRLQTAERWFALLLISVSISFHVGNVLIAIVALPALAAMAVAGWRPGPQALHRFFLMIGAAALGVAALVSANVTLRGQFVISPASSTFLFAKLLADGPAFEVLESECPEAHYAVCSQLERIRAYKAKAADPDSLVNYFLWDGPLASLGWFKGFEPEAKILVGKALKRVSWNQVRLSLRHSATQFSRVAVGDSLLPYPEDVPPSPQIRSVFGGSVYASYLASRQEKGTLDLDFLNVVYSVALAISAFVLLAASVLWRRTDRVALYVGIFTLVFLAGNAVVTGTLSEISDRYQSRTVRLVPLFAVLFLIRRIFGLHSLDCDNVTAQSSARVSGETVSEGGA